MANLEQPVLRDPENMSNRHGLRQTREALAQESPCDEGFVVIRVTTCFHGAPD
jgi:hypothetical protein